MTGPVDRKIFGRQFCYPSQRIGALLLAKKFEEFPDVVRKAPRVVVYHGGSKMLCPNR